MELPPDFKEVEIPVAPQPDCKLCYGRGHIGQDHETRRFKACPRCYPGGKPTVMAPLELREALLEAKQDPEMWKQVQLAVMEADAVGDGPEVP